MILGFFRRKQREGTIDALYGAIVTQSRDPAFYREHGVADTMDGRFEMIVLHMFLVLHRLKEEPPERRELGQALFDLLFLDFDRALREIGVGDTSVPKRIKAMGEAFYGRIKAYDEALASPEGEALGRALARNVLGEPKAEAKALAAYVRAAVAELAAMPFSAFAAGRVGFPAVPRGEAA